MCFNKFKLLKNLYKNIYIAIFCFVFFVSCDKNLATSKLPYVGSIEGNHPWLVFDPTMEQGRVFECGDKQDPNVIYLVFVMKKGDAVKINLITKKITPYHFNVEKWEDVLKQTVRYESAEHFRNSKMPLWLEFRGRKEDSIVNHLYGDPNPNQLGTRVITRRTGYYYIMDDRDGFPFELLRVKIINSELDFGGLGNSTITPDGKWIIFVLDNDPSRTFIFNRNDKVSPTFQSDNEDQAIEVWKEWGKIMGAKP